MSERANENGERARALLMMALDGELDDAGRREFERLIAERPAARAEFLRLRAVKEATGTMRYDEPPGEVWDGYWTSVYNRVERGAGWVLVSAGAATLAGFGLWRLVERLLADADVPVYVKLAVFGTLLGATLLLLSVGREKWFTRRRDPYKEIRR